MRRILVVALALTIALAMVRHVVDAVLGTEPEEQRRFAILMRSATRRSKLGADRIKAIDCEEFLPLNLFDVIGFNGGCELTIIPFA